MDERLIIRQLTTTNYLVVNRTLIQTFGLEAAIFLSHLLDRFTYLQETNQLADDEWFYQTHEQQITSTGLKEYTISKCKKIYKDKDVLETKWIGMPAKEHYRINIANLFKCLSDAHPRSACFAELAPPNTCGLAPPNTCGLYSINKQPNKKQPNSPLKHPPAHTVTILGKLPPKWKADPDLVAAIEDWVEYRSTKTPGHFTPPVIQALVKKLTKFTIPQICEAVETAIASGWLGIFPRSPEQPRKLSLSSGRANNTEQDYSFSQKLRLEGTE